MTRPAIYLLAGLALPVLTGCSPGQYFAQPASVEETRDRARQIEEEQQALAKRIAAMEAQLAEQRELLTGSRADMNTQLEQMARNLEEISNQLGDMTGQLNRRRGAPPPSLYPPPVEAPVEPADGSGAAVAGPDGDEAPGIDAEQVYDQAYRDVTRGSYALAVSGFTEFLRLFPDHALSDNAQYWLGECHYVQNDMESAITEFEKVLVSYPNGDKVPAAHLKLGYCKLRQNDTDSARAYFQDLIRNHPTSEEARSARAKLATLN